jgi:hypothetical protein
MQAIAAAVLLTQLVLAQVFLVGMADIKRRPARRWLRGRRQVGEGESPRRTRSIAHRPHTRGPTSSRPNWPTSGSPQKTPSAN